jgi:hypothetical protein
MALTGILLRMGALRAVSADPEERALHNMADALLEEMREAAPDRALLITANLRGLGDVLRVVNKGVSDG